MSSYDIHLSVNGAERRERHRVTNRDRAVWERNRSRDEKLDSRNWRERMRLNHGTPESNGKNPKRQLFGPPTEPRASTEMVSPTPSKTTNLDDDIENVNRATSSYSPSVGRTTRRKLVMQTESIPSKQFEITPPSLHGSVNPAVRPSLVVKLKIRRPSGTMNVETRRKHKSPSSDAITKDDTAMKEGAVSQGTSYVRTHEWRRETRSTAPITRRRQGDLAADGAHNDTAPDHTYPSTIAVASTIYQNM